MFVFVATLLIGLGAGVVGGLAGIGGSIIMLPGLAIVLGYATPARDEHHLYMAAAMLVNVVVAYFSRVQHARQGAVRRELVRPILASMSVSIVLGVLAVNLFDGTVAKNVLIVFLGCYCLFNLYSAIRKLPEPEPHHQWGGKVLLVSIGCVTGFLGGFLGIGGGIVMVPLLQIVAKVPLRQCIAASAAVMWVTALIGSVTKLALLHTHGQDWLDALAIAGPMALGAVAGARFGAWCTHRLHLPYLKVAISVILGASAVKMAYDSLTKFKTRQSDSVEVDRAPGGQEPTALTPHEAP